MKRIFPILFLVECLLFSIDSNAKNAKIDVNKRDSTEARSWNCSVGIFEKLLREALIEWSKKQRFETDEEYQQRIENTANYALKENSIRLLESRFYASPEHYNPRTGIYQFLLIYDWTFRYTIGVSVPIDVERARRIQEYETTTKLTDCVIGADNDTLKIQYWRIQIGYDYGVSESTGVHDFIIYGKTVLPEVEAMKDVQFNYSAYMRGETEELGMMLCVIADYNEKKNQEVTQINNIIKVSPYYKALENISESESFLASFEPKDFNEGDDISEIRAYYIQIQTDEAKMSALPYLAKIKEYLRGWDTEKYAEAFFEEYPELMPIIEKEYREYRCHYPKIGSFIIAREDGKVDAMQRDCRFLKWAEYKDYYESREEFDIDYDKGEEVLKQHKQREIYRKQYGKYYADKETYETDYANNTNLLIARKKEVDAHMEVIEKHLPCNLKGAMESSDQTERQVALCFANLAKAPVFQNKAAEMLVSQNKQIAKEYKKNGRYFASKVEFLMSYISANYKKILKSNK